MKREVGQEEVLGKWGDFVDGAIGSFAVDKVRERLL